MSRDYSLGEIATYLEAELRGDPEARITGLSSLSAATGGDLSFLTSAKYVSQLVGCQAGAVMLVAEQAASYAGNCLVLDNPYVGYAKISAWFDTMPEYLPEVHPSAAIDVAAVIAGDVYIGPNVVVEAGVRLGAGCRLAANSFVGARSVLGKDCSIGPNVTIYHDAIIGSEVRVHSGTVIGSDGFGFAPAGPDGWHKIHQIGGVVIGNKVEIGACCTIDRGAIDDTIIGDNVILDNHIHLAHNVMVGDNTAMAAGVIIAGSSTIGRNCTFAGASGAIGHLTICDNVHLTVCTLVTKNITEPGSYSSGMIPTAPSLAWKKNALRFGQLDVMARRLKTLEKKS